ncbi:MAG: DUF11 domain-containing protein [Planctomyces sp.]|nr:DUF11 domain-containing protein [Planctomyces sp.]
MTTIWAFVFVCILSLMFLGMLYGEKLSVLGLLEGRWARPIAELPGLIWEELCRTMDLVVLFVTEHFSWVVATTSGSIGLFIVAFLMFSGMAEDAAAVNRDLRTPLLSGGVLDEIPDIRGKVTVNDPPPILKFDGDSRVVQQDPAAGYVVFNKPDLRDINPDPPPIWTENDQDPIGQFPTPDAPLLGLQFRRIASGTSLLDDEPTITVGRLTESSPLPRIINDALRRLPTRERWQMALSSGEFGNEFPVQDRMLEEASELELRDLESRVRVIPGGEIAEHDLRIEKIYPTESSGTDVTVEVALLNVGNDTIRGLLVREYLPRGTQIRDADNGAILRDDVLTWLVDSLPPYEERILRFTAVAPVQGRLSSRRTRFESQTEVSALSAVTSITEVRDRSPIGRPTLPLEDFDDLDRPLPERPTPSRPGLITAPDVRMMVREPLTPVQVGSIVEVMFELTNVGDGIAKQVEVRVNLDPGMRHVKTDGSIVVSEANNLKPGDTREIPLRFRLTGPGEYLPSAELFLNGESVDWKRMRIVGERQSESFPTEIR